MKKFFVLFLMAFSLFASIEAKADVLALKRISLTCSKVPWGNIGNHPPRTPMAAPVVYIDDHTLYFTNLHPEYSLQIAVNHMVVYNVTVSSSTGSVELPDSLSGTYEIFLVWSDWIAYGEINL